MTDHDSVLIRSFDARLVRVPLSRPWAEDVTTVDVIATHVVRSDGEEGWGMSWTPRIGGTAVLALLRNDIAPFVIGRSADATGIWDDVWRHLHEAGGGGITTIGLAGLDLALWDAAARAAGGSVSDLLGRRRSTVRVYGSGINLHYPLTELAAQATRWVDAGFDAVKVKVGKPDVSEDLDRLHAVREIIGPGRALMIDANQRWDLRGATHAADVLAAVDPAWIEEPMRADDLASHVELARRTPIPIAVGENLHTTYRFVEYLDAGGARIVQPNIVRVGGITPFLRIAAIAAERGAALHPHLLPELSGQIALTLPPVDGVADPMVEEVEDAGLSALGALSSADPVTIRGGFLTENPHDGLGLIASPGGAAPAGSGSRA